MACAKPIVPRSSTPVPIIFQTIDNYMSHDKMADCNINTNPRSNQNRFSLCIKGVPPNLDERMLKNLLSIHGNVTNVTAPKSSHCSYFFADCPTQKDFEAVLKGMQNNDYKLKVEPKTGKKNQDINNDQLNKYIETNSNHSDIKSEQHGDSNGRRHNRHGRTIRRNNEKLNIKEISDQSGIRTNSTPIISHKSLPSIKLNNSTDISSQLKLGPCRTCKQLSNKICERCDEYYCSVACQSRDWENHRFYCFKMPNLITINNDENKENTENLNISNNQKNNLSINELKNQFMNVTKSTDSNNRQKNNLSIYHKLEQNLNGAGTVPKQNQLPNKTNDNRYKRMNARPAFGNNKTIGPDAKQRNSGNLAQTKTDNIIESPIVNNPTSDKVPNSVQSVPKTQDPIKLQTTILPVVNNPSSAEVPKSGETVFMTHIEKSNMVYIRSNVKSENDDYVGILNKVAKSSQNANYLKKLPSVYEYVAANFEGTWYRAIVLANQNPEKILIAYVEFGNKEHKKISELKELQPECYNLKQYPTLIHLKNVPNCDVNDDFTNYMKNFVENGVQLKIIYKSNDLKDFKIFAELYNLVSNENINDKCIELLKPIMFNINESLIQEPVMAVDIKEEPLAPGENIPIVVVGHAMIENGIIYCISSNEFKDLCNLNDKITKYVESTTEYYSPRIEEMCIAKSDDEAWYRAYCEVEATDDEDDPTLYFPDYGYNLKVSIQNIRKYPKAFTLPFKTDECLIAGLGYLMESENENPKLEKRLRELLPLNKVIIVPKIEYDDGDSDTITVHFPHILDTLILEGLHEK